MALPWLIAIPAAIVAKKVYNKMTEDNSSSSSYSYDYEAERRRERERQRDNLRSEIADFERQKIAEIKSRYGAQISFVNSSINVTQKEDNEEIKVLEDANLTLKNALNELQELRA